MCFHIKTISISLRYLKIRLNLKQILWCSHFLFHWRANLAQYSFGLFNFKFHFFAKLRERDFHALILIKLVILKHLSKLWLKLFCKLPLDRWCYFHNTHFVQPGIVKSVLFLNKGTCRCGLITTNCLSF